MKGTGSKNAWALFLLILAGIVLGGFIGMLADGVSALSWLNYGQSFGLDEPVILNLGLLVVTFGLTIKIPPAPDTFPGYPGISHSLSPRPPPAFWSPPGGGFWGICIILP